MYIYIYLAVGWVVQSTNLFFFWWVLVVFRMIQKNYGTIELVDMTIYTWTIRQSRFVVKDMWKSEGKINHIAQLHNSIHIPYCAGF